MEKEKFHFLLWFAVAALAVIVLWEIQRPVAASITAPTVDPASPTDSIILTPENSSGTDYLTYNTPWAFAPPVQNVLPTTTIGQVGQVAGQGPSPESSCFTCGGN